MKRPPDPHYRHRFPAEIISHAVWLYHVFSLSLRDVELILADRDLMRGDLTCGPLRDQRPRRMAPIQQRGVFSDLPGRPGDPSLAELS
jgi:hypothetical protein